MIKKTNEIQYICCTINSDILYTLDVYFLFNVYGIFPNYLDLR